MFVTIFVVLFGYWYGMSLFDDYGFLHWPKCDFIKLWICTREITAGVFSPGIFKGFLSLCLLEGLV